MLPEMASEILYNFQGSDQKDPIVEKWFRSLNVKGILKRFQGIVFEAREDQGKLLVNIVFRGSRRDIKRLSHSLREER